MRKTIESLGRRVPLRDPGPGHGHPGRQNPGRGHRRRGKEFLRNPHNPCYWPQRTGHLPDARRPWRGHDRQALFRWRFRIEHPQAVINRARFGKQAGHPLLGAADYKLVHHCKNGRSVYSFCMCPGGIGGCRNLGARLRRHQRHEPVQPETNKTPTAPSSSASRQKTIPADHWRASFSSGAGSSAPLFWAAKNYDAPGQLVGDFLAGRPSTALGTVQPSYRPGVRLTDLETSLPDYAVAAIREAIPAFDRKTQGICHGRRRVDRGRDPHLLPLTDPPGPGRSEYGHTRPLSRRGRRRLCRRHRLVRRGRHQGGGSRGPQHPRDARPPKPTSR